ncbi:hypothetical protein BHE74_00003030 [Ensete ventricosum]|nr:hypothetical protein BHE74_00003030 [Ensete ventricosum]
MQQHLYQNLTNELSSRKHIPPASTKSKSLFKGVVLIQKPSLLSTQRVGKTRNPAECVRSQTPAPDPTLPIESPTRIRDQEPRMGEPNGGERHGLLTNRKTGRRDQDLVARRRLPLTSRALALLSSALENGDYRCCASYYSLAARKLTPSTNGGVSRASRCRRSLDPVGAQRRLLLVRNRHLFTFR